MYYLSNPEGFLCNYNKNNNVGVLLQEAIGSIFDLFCEPAGKLKCCSMWATWLVQGNAQNAMCRCPVFACSSISWHFCNLCVATPSPSRFTSFTLNRSHGRGEFNTHTPAISSAGSCHSWVLELTQPVLRRKPGTHRNQMRRISIVASVRYVHLEWKRGAGGKDTDHAEPCTDVPFWAHSQLVKGFH